MSAVVFFFFINSIMLLVPFGLLFNFVISAGPADSKADIGWTICMHAGDIDYSPEMAKTAFQQMQEMGFTMVRTDFDWSKFQPSLNANGSAADQFESEAVSFFDQYVELAAEHELEVIAILSHPPSWAMELYKAGSVDSFLDAYKAYSKKMASLYGSRVRYFQYWNEPNNVINPIESRDQWRVYLAADQGVRQGSSSLKNKKDIVGSVNYNADSIYRGTWYKELKREFSLLAKEDPNHTIRIIAIDTYPSTWSLPANLRGWSPIMTLNDILNDPLHPCYGFRAALSETGYSQVFGRSWMRRSQKSQSDWFRIQLPYLRNTLASLSPKWLWIGIYELYDANSQTNKYFDPEALFGLYESDRKSAKEAVATIKSLLLQ